MFLFLGYICLPLFCFIISEGYRHTRSINKYLLRVLLLSVLTALPHRYVCISPENASDPQLFFSSALTGLFCLMSIVIYDKIKNKYAKIYCLVFTVVISFVCGLEFAPHALIIMYIILLFSLVFIFLISNPIITLLYMFLHSSKLSFWSIYPIFCDMPSDSSPSI